MCIVFSNGYDHKCYRQNADASIVIVRCAGRANLPGSTRERDMLHSFSRMLPELLRHSDRPDVFELVPSHLKNAHRPRDVNRDDAPCATRQLTNHHGRNSAGKRKATLNTLNSGFASERKRGNERSVLSLWDDDDEVLPPLQATGPMHSMCIDDGLYDAEAEKLFSGTGF